MPSPTPDRLEPFDITYRLVTDRITVAARNLPDDTESGWLKALRDGFWREYQHWDDGRYDAYWLSFSRLRPRLLRLAACAYLHISYDLPRVTADNWPGVAPRLPTEVRGELIYFQLNPIFLDVFSEVAHKRRVVGAWVPVSGLAPRGATNAAAHWAIHLRTASWGHARQLQVLPGREFRERRMLEAMTAALDDVSSMPWSPSVLFPPHEAVLNSMLAAPLPVLQLAWDHPAISGIVAAAGLALGLGFWQLLRARREEELTRFINELGQRTLEYVAAANSDPEGFERYLLGRRPPSSQEG